VAIKLIIYKKNITYRHKETPIVFSIITRNII